MLDLRSLTWAKVFFIFAKVVSASRTSSEAVSQRERSVSTGEQARTSSDVRSEVDEDKWQRTSSTCSSRRRIFLSARAVWPFWTQVDRTVSEHLESLESAAWGSEAPSAVLRMAVWANCIKSAAVPADVGGQVSSPAVWYVSQVTTMEMDRKRTAKILRCGYRCNSIQNIDDFRLQKVQSKQERITNITYLGSLKLVNLYKMFHFPGWLNSMAIRVDNTGA